jgi:hypothetical protein
MSARHSAFADVGPHEDGPAGLPRDAGRRRFAGAVASVPDDHLRAFGREQPRDALPHSGAGAGDHGDAVGQAGRAQKCSAIFPRRNRTDCLSSSIPFSPSSIEIQPSKPRSRSALKIAS